MIQLVRKSDELRIATDAVKYCICLLREKAGDDWDKVKRELLAAIEEADNDSK